MKKAVSMFLVLTMLAATVIGCGSEKSDDSKSQSETNSDDTSGSDSEPATGGKEMTFQIGGIGPITGGAASYGLGVMNGAQIAIDEINADGGINGKMINYNFQDDEHDPEKAINAYNTLKDWGMQILMGTVTSSPCIAVGAESSADGIFQLTPSGSSPEAVAPENVFQVCFSDPNQGQASAQYIADNSLAKKVAVIYDSSDAYSTGIYESFAKEAEAKGIELTSAQAFTADNNTDFSVQLQAAQQEKADLIFLPIYYKEAALILQQANTMGYKPKFFGCDGMDGILSSVEGFDASLAEGVMLLTPFAADDPSEAIQSFVTKYQDAYEEVPNQFAADAYDAIYAIKAAAEKAELTPDMSPADMGTALIAAMPEIELAGLTSTEGTPMKWAADGTVNKAPKAVIIQDGKYKAM
jgi:branched-chain amino acid transport system substrate-binding protein